MSLSLPPPVSGATPTSSHRLSQSLSRRTREALEDFHYHCHPYGPNAGLCLVSRSKARYCLTIAHFVQRCSKPEQLSLYEYCLGCDWNTFDVNSIHNLAYLDPSWHHLFDIGAWLLLPDLSTLQEVKGFVQAALTARENGSKTENFLTKWNLGLMTTYSFLKLPRFASTLPIPRREQLAELWEINYPPFCLFPALKSHVSPPLAVINGGPRLAGLDLEAVALTHHGQNSDETDLAATRERLTLLRHIWGLITDAKDAAKKWENENRRKKKKHHNQDDDDIDTLSQITSSTTCSSEKCNRTPGPTHHAIGGTRHGKKNLGTRKRGREMTSSSTTLTGDVLTQLGKRHKGTEIKEWVESISSA